MTAINVFAVRRAILNDLRDYAGVPVSLDDLWSTSARLELISRGSGVASGGVPDFIAEEWKNLQIMGFLKAVDGFGGLYCEITQRGFEQLSIEFKRDPYIWGPVAAGGRG